MCRRCLCNLYGYDERTLRRHAASVRSGAMNFDHSSKGMHRKGRSAHYARVYGELHHIVLLDGEDMPNAAVTEMPQGTFADIAQR